MNRILHIIDSIPLPIFAIAAIFMSLAPFPAQPTPHLVEKIVMLFDGMLSKGMDIFDLFWHGLFPVLLLIKIIRMVNVKNSD